MSKRTRQLLIDVDGVGERKCGDCAMVTPSPPQFGGGRCLEFGQDLEPTRRVDNFWRCDECLAAEGRANARDYGQEHPHTSVDPVPSPGVEHNIVFGQGTRCGARTKFGEDVVCGLPPGHGGHHVCETDDETTIWPHAVATQAANSHKNCCGDCKS